MEPYVYDVHVEMLHPVRAKPGHRLVVRPGHAERPILVMERTPDGWKPLRIGPPNFGTIVSLCDDGALSQRHPVYASLAQHPAVQTA